MNHTFLPIGLLASLLIVLMIALGCAPQPSATPLVAEPSPTIEKLETLAATATPTHTATPRLAQPRPTLTPVPTATPIIYEVVVGDTIWNIAAEYNVAIARLQAVNGLADIEALSIGQQLVIPPNEEANIPPTPTATPLPLTVQGVHFVRTPQERLWVLGELNNPGDDVVSDVRVQVALFDEAGVLTTQETGFVALYGVPSGQSIPFSILIDRPPAAFAQYQVQVLSGLALAGDHPYVFELNVTDLREVPTTEALYRVAGTLHNPNDIDVVNIRLVAVAYSAEGLILAERLVEPPADLLRAEASTPFTIDLLIPKGVVNRYTVVAQGIIAE